jgi:putative flippase GtrA
MNIFIREAVRYTAVSGCALIVDFSILWMLVHYFSWGTIAAASASFVFGSVVAYALSLKLVFTHRRLKDPRVEFVSFVVIGVVGLLINAAVISLAVGYLGVHYLIAKCGAAGFTFAWGFIARRQLLFVQRSSVDTP